MTTPLLIQGSFHILYFVAFTLIGIRFAFQSRQSGNMIGRYFALAFFTGALEWLMVAVAALLLPDKLVAVRFIGIACWLLSYASVASMWFAVALIYPKLHLKYALIPLALVALAHMAYYAQGFRPAAISPAGFIDFDHPGASLMVGNMVNGLTFLPIGIAFLVRTIRSGLMAKGVLFGLGLIIVALFIPLTNEVSTNESYVFFSTAVVAGLALITVSFAINKPAKKKKKA